MPLRNAIIVFGGLLVLIAVFAIVFWLPNDTGSAMIVHVRGRVKIGDELAPAVAFVVLGLAGLLLIFEARGGQVSQYPSARNLRYAGLLFVIFVIAMLLMRWTGPIAVSIANGQDSAGYRELRDTAPWKYLGFLGGGTFLVASMISISERRLTWRAVLVGLAAASTLIMLYDVPFGNLLLPPNGDV